MVWLFVNGSLIYDLTRLHMNTFEVTYALKCAVNSLQVSQRSYTYS